MLIEAIASLLFAVAILHTFCAPVFIKLAHRGGCHAGLWHILGEVETVFGVWAAALVIAMVAVTSPSAAVAYVQSRNFTEPLFVFVIMVVASSRPILALVGRLVAGLARCLPLRRKLAVFFVTLSVVPLTGSLITEPAAMTLAALMLRDTYFRHTANRLHQYLVLAVLLVNVSIGGVLTAYAAPPVLMVAATFGWDSAYMLAEFGWRAVTAVFINATLLALIVRGSVSDTPPDVTQAQAMPPVPGIVMLVHAAFLAIVVLNAHTPAVFIGVLVLFLGYVHAYPRHQSSLLLKEGMLVGFFLAGLVMLGGMQSWWLQDLLGDLSSTVLFWGAAGLTALTDNAALTYLGAMVEGTSEQWRYMLVAGAVTGGGLTVIANAPNPAAFALLKGSFANQRISPLWLLVSALVPTLVAAALFLWS
jgi:hypothetical protein